MRSLTEPLVLAVHDVAFLNWSVPPEDVRALLPPGTRPDTWQGRAYVGLVALRMAGVRPAIGPPLPYLSTFPQVNVRTYVRDADDRPGLVFLSMLAPRLVPALCGRLTLGLPYRWTRIRAEKGAGLQTYDLADGKARVAVHIGKRLDGPDPFAAFLTDRPALYQSHGGLAYRLANSHSTWPLHEAEVADAGEQLVQRALGRTAGLGAPDSALWSPGVRMRFGLPQRLPPR